MERTLDGGVGGVGEDGAAEDAHHVTDPHGEARLAVSSPAPPARRAGNGGISFGSAGRAG